MISSPPLNQQLNPYSRLQFPSTYQKNTPLSSVGYQYPGMIGNSMYPPYGGGPGYAFPSSTYASSGLPVGLPGHGHNIGLAGLSRAIVGQSGFPRTGPSVFPQEYQARSVGVQQGYSRMEYIPYQSYYIDYQQQHFVQNIMVPIERTVTDYYAVEHVVDYIPRQYEQVVVQNVAQQRVFNHLHYVPVETSIVHPPQSYKVREKLSPVVTSTTQGQIIAPGPNIVRGGSQVQIVNNVAGVSRTIIGQQPIPVQNVQNVRSVSPPPIVKSPSQVRQIVSPPPPTINQVQQPPRTVSPPKAQIQQTINAQRVPQPNVTLPPQPQGQIIQNAQTQPLNQVQLQRKLSLPTNTNVQYQYSTRTVRNLSPQEINNMGLNKPGVVSGVARPNQTLGQNPTINVNNLQPPTVHRSNSLSSPQNLRPISTGAATLIKNQSVDLADSQHIDITKSKFNAQYAPATQVPNFGQAPNPNFTTTKNQSAFSFTQQQRMEQVGNNRISKQPVYDYNKLGDY